MIDFLKLDYKHFLPYNFQSIIHRKIKLLIGAI